MAEYGVRVWNNRGNVIFDNYYPVLEVVAKGVSNVHTWHDRGQGHPSHAQLDRTWIRRHDEGQYFERAYYPLYEGSPGNNKGKNFLTFLEILPGTRLSVHTLTSAPAGFNWYANKQSIRWVTCRISSAGPKPSGYGIEVSDENGDRLWSSATTAAQITGTLKDGTTAKGDWFLITPMTTVFDWYGGSKCYYYAGVYRDNNRFWREFWSGRDVGPASLENRATGSIAENFPAGLVADIDWDVI